MMVPEVVRIVAVLESDPLLPADPIPGFRRCPPWLFLTSTPHLRIRLQGPKQTGSPPLMLLIP